VFLLAVVVLALTAVPCTGGRLGRLTEMRLRGGAVLATALVAQIIVVSIVSDAPQVDTTVHVLSYGAALAFVAMNLRVKGMWLVAVGGVANFAAIASNNGVMPASAAALRAAGQRVHASQFVNSAPVRGARLRLLGDVFAIPASWPLHNVFSVGDVILGIGIAVVIHRACRPQTSNDECRDSASRASAADKRAEHEAAGATTASSSGEPARITTGYGS
jgi:hypothetical protein